MAIFDIDGPLMRFLEKVANLMWLNVLTMICCIPVFTAGAAFTALHYMCLKIVRDEESYITKAYFKSFKENFRQSTIIWLAMLALAAFLGLDFYIIIDLKVELPHIVKLLVLAVGVLAAFTAVMIFPIQAKFDNPIKYTIKNAFAVSVLQFPKTFVMLVLLFVPMLLCYVSMQIFPVVFLFGFSLPAYFSAHLYNKTFLSMEQQILGNEEASGEETAAEEGEDERIFKDEPESEETEAEQ
ncbi:MAG: DUF624 domain-containing protein [Bacteroidales bacterium]|nr:DUF624 domain-containing protein [Lachnoclostridium sp.]MCM1385524.1 DUF624 domain-containing protein [Lachnoclostridium sp.]MCM1466305.1 DUF624 domain-containing protein [Bacteroidales bacterium]